MNPSTSATATLKFSLKPLVILINLFGFTVPIDDGIIIKENNSLVFDAIHPFSITKFFKWAILLPLGGLILLAEIGFYIFASIVNIQMANYFFQCSPTCLGINITSTDIFGILMGFFNLEFFVVLTHLTFFVTVWFFAESWKCLWLNLKQIQQHLRLEIPFYRRVRNIVWLSILLLVADAAFFVYPISFSNIWFWPYTELTDWRYLIFIVIVNLSRTIAVAIITTFSVLVFVVADLFVVLNCRVNSLVVSYNTGGINDSQLVTQLENWRNHHTIVCQFARWINKVFNPIILVTICNCFISFIAYSYAIIESFQKHLDDLKFIYFALFFQQLIRLLYFIYAPFKLALQV